MAIDFKKDVSIPALITTGVSDPHTDQILSDRTDVLQIYHGAGLEGDAVNAAKIDYQSIVQKQARLHGGDASDYLNQSLNGEVHEIHKFEINVDDPTHKHHAGFMALFADVLRHGKEQGNLERDLSNRLSGINGRGPLSC